MNRIPVAALKCESYDEKRLDDVVSKAIELIGGINDLIKPGSKVLLKVNLLMAIAPEHGSTTHPAMVRAVAKYLQQKGCEVWVGDSSSWNTKKALKVAGIQEAAESLGVKVLNFNEFTPVKVSLPPGSALNETYLGQPLFDADVIISLPKLKSHELTGFSGCIKNSFGMVVGHNKGEIHRLFPKIPDFANAVIDIFMLKQPAMFIMDGIICVEGTAAKGSPKKIGVLLASKNGFALDTVAEKIIGFKPENLPIPKEAKRRGIPGNSMEEIELLGDPLKQLIVRYKKPGTMATGVMKRFHGWFMRETKQKLNPDLCIKCGVCAKCCPVKAITLNPYPEFDFEKCIHCWCCAEVCNQGAIKVKVPSATQLFGFN
jgi:uncharacterized protein (DUF362 family)/NAD-dependent dihydropyrimidine dehydrogenase PreA subunit